MPPEALAKTKALPLAQPGAPATAAAPPGAAPAPAPVTAPLAALPVPAWWNSQARVLAHRLTAVLGLHPCLLLIQPKALWQSSCPVTRRRCCWP